MNHRFVYKERIRRNNNIYPSSSPLVHLEILNVNKILLVCASICIYNKSITQLLDYLICCWIIFSYNSELYVIQPIQIYKNILHWVLFFNELFLEYHFYFMHVEVNLLCTLYRELTL